MKNNQDLKNLLKVHFQILIMSSDKVQKSY